jgi:broad specificity phosphatase PhoE
MVARWQTALPAQRQCKGSQPDPVRPASNCNVSWKPAKTWLVRAMRFGPAPWKSEMVPVVHPTMRLFVVARHAESSSNVTGMVSSDPRQPVALTQRGRVQARQLGAQLADLEIDIAVCTRLLRTQQTVELALRARPVPVIIDEDFDEVRTGVFDEEPIGDYWSWEQQHLESERLPRGESVDEALTRYAKGLRRLLLRTEPVTLLVLHEFALHRIATAGTASSSLTASANFTNALPYLFDENALERAAAHLETSTRRDDNNRRAP